MAKTLHLTDAIDENLKLVRDDDGTDTPVQLSKDKLKVVGDTDITSNLSVNGDVKIDPAKKLYLDGGTDTYISESSTDGVSVVVGGDYIATLKSTLSVGYSDTVWVQRNG